MAYAVQWAFTQSGAIAAPGFVPEWKTWQSYSRRSEADADLWRYAKVVKPDLFMMRIVRGDRVVYGPVRARVIR
jgi:hypothetical protein